MFEENNSQEKIFNLQLTIQKLEEELQLYRNGTSVTELLELIHEKDVEIETLQLQNEEKGNKLKKLAKTSGEVLIKYENIQIELQNKQDYIYDLEKNLLQLQNLVTEKEDFIEHEIKVKQEEAKRVIAEKDSIIGELELKLWEKNEESAKQCKLWEEERNETKELLTRASERIEGLESDFLHCQQQLKKSQDTVLLLEKETPFLREQVASLDKLVEQQKKIIVESDQSIQQLQKRCSTLISEHKEKQKILDSERQQMIKNIQEFRDTMNNTLLQRDESLRKKDDKIRELSLQISVLQQQKSRMTMKDLDKENVLNK
eukprot:gene13148-14430_t